MLEKVNSSSVANGIAQAIFEHKLQPGAKLSEDEVGEVFGVSRTIVRAALQKLVHDRLIEQIPNRGAFVAHPGPREAREVFEARALLEPRTSRSAAERMTAADLRALEDLIKDEHQALAENKLGKALNASGQFHIKIATIADQATITAFIESLVARSSLIIALYWRRQSALCESHAHHALIGAFRDGDADFAEELMQSHIVDLLTSLDLTSKATPGLSVKDALTL